MKFGVIDIGSNSVRMAWLSQEAKKGTLPQEKLQYSRLVEGASSSGILTQEAVNRTIQAVKSLLDDAKKQEIEILQISATSALREANNRKDVVDAMKTSLGYEVRILSTEEEAYLSYFGATMGMPRDDRQLVVLDIGGGSVELCWGDGSEMSASLPLGAVRVKEAGTSMGELFAAFMPMVEKVPKRPMILVGVGGTLTTMAAIFEGMTSYQPTLIHQLTYGINAIEQLNQALKQMPSSEREALPGMTKGRNDIMTYGLDIAIVIMKLLNTTTLTVSASDLLLGELLMLMEKRGE